MAKEVATGQHNERMKMIALAQKQRAAAAAVLELLKGRLKEQLSDASCTALYHN